MKIKTIKLSGTNKILANLYISAFFSWRLVIKYNLRIEKNETEFSLDMIHVFHTKL